MSEKTNQTEISIPEPAVEAPAPAAPAVSETPEALMAAASARIAELEAEVSAMKDRWLRAEAEMANLRARTRREVEEVRLFAVHAFAHDVVEAAENLRRGLASIPPAEPGEPEVLARLREGFAGVERGLLAILDRHGIRREDPTGVAFDPNLHQAMMEEVSETHPAGTVVQAWTSAWTLNGRLLRPAMVVVAKPASPPTDSAERLDTIA